MCRIELPRPRLADAMRPLVREVAVAATSEARGAMQPNPRTEHAGIGIWAAEVGILIDEMDIRRGRRWRPQVGGRMRVGVRVRAS